MSRYFLLNEKRVASLCTAHGRKSPAPSIFKAFYLGKLLWSIYQVAYKAFCFKRCGTREGLQQIQASAQADLPLRPVTQLTEWYLENLWQNGMEYVAIVTPQCRFLRFWRKAISSPSNYFSLVKLSEQLSVIRNTKWLWKWSVRMATIKNWVLPDPRHYKVGCVWSHPIMTCDWYV